MNGFRTIATVATSGDRNGRGPAEAADLTRAKLVEHLEAWEQAGYVQCSNITLVYKATTIGMRWIASVKMSKEG